MIPRVTLQDTSNDKAAGDDLVVGARAPRSIRRAGGALRVVAHWTARGADRESWDSRHVRRSPRRAARELAAVAAMGWRDLKEKARQGCARPAGAQVLRVGAGHHPP